MGVPTTINFRHGGGLADTIGSYKLPVPESRTKYGKTVPRQFGEFAAAQAWWIARKE